MTVELSGLLLLILNGELSQEKLLETLVGIHMEERNKLQMTFPTSSDLMDSPETKEDLQLMLLLLEDKTTVEPSMSLLLTLNMETFREKPSETPVGIHMEEMSKQPLIFHSLLPHSSTTTNATTQDGTDAHMEFKMMELEMFTAPLLTDNMEMFREKPLETLAGTLGEDRNMLLTTFHGLLVMLT